MWLPLGPFRAPGLRMMDRLFYLEMPLYWISQYGFLALLLLAPLVYFWTGVPVFASTLDDAVAHVIPRLVATSMVSYWISRGKVMPVITDIKKLVGVFYILAAILSLAINPRGKPFKPTLKGEVRDTIVVHWTILAPFLVLGTLVGAGIGWNLLTDQGPVAWDEYLPMNIALGLYVIAMEFLCCLACIDWPNNTTTPNYAQTVEGRWLPALTALLFIPHAGGTPTNTSRSVRAKLRVAGRRSWSRSWRSVMGIACGVAAGLVSCSSEEQSGRAGRVHGESAAVRQAMVSAPAPRSDALHCVAFSAYVDGYSPEAGVHPDASVIDALLDDLVAHTDFRCLMTYGVLNGQDYVFHAARARGLAVIAILWLDGNHAADDASVIVGIQRAKDYRDTIVRVACGSEVRVRHGAAMAQAVVGACVSRLRAAGVTQPIGTNDSWWAMCDEAWPCRPWAFARELDWIGVNVYAWWENRYSRMFPCVPATQSAAFHVARLQDVRAQYPPTDVVLTEFGWPAGPADYGETNQFTGQRCGVASEPSQRLVVNATVRELRRLSLGHVVFSAYREAWKTSEGPVGPWWGLLNSLNAFARR